MSVGKQFIPLYISFTMLGLGISFGYNSGYAVNPARDLAPRLFTAVAGWGPEVFTEYSSWWLVPVLATHAGGVAGAGLYYLAVQAHWGREMGDFEDDMKDTMDSIDTIDDAMDTLEVNHKPDNDDMYVKQPVEYKIHEEINDHKERY